MALKLVGPVVDTVNGDRWTAHRCGKVVTLIMNAPGEEIVMPEGWRPASNVQGAITGLNNDIGRVIINASTGVVTPFIDGNYYGTVTYLTA